MTESIFKLAIPEFLDHIPFPVCILSRTGDVVSTNAEFGNFIGEENVFSLSSDSPISPVYRKRLAQSYLSALKGQLKRCFAVLTDKNGDNISVEIYLLPFFSDSEETNILTLFRKVDDRIISFNSSTSAIMDGSEIQSCSPNLFKFSPFPILKIDKNIEVVEASSSSEIIFAVIKDKLIDKPEIFKNCFQEYDYERIKKITVDISEGNLSFKRLTNIKIVNLQEQTFWLNLFFYGELEKNKNKYIEVIIEDVTKQHQYEEELNRVRNIQFVGDLSQGLVHSVNSLNNVILSYSQMMQNLTEKEKIKDGLKIIQDSAEECNQQVKLVQDYLLTQDSQSEEVVSLIDFLDPLIDFMKIAFKISNRGHGNKIDIQKRYFATLKIKANVQHLKDLFIAMIYRVVSYNNYHGLVTAELRQHDNENYFMVSVEKSKNLDDDFDEPLVKKISSSDDVRKIAEKLKVRIFEEDSPEVFSLKAIFPPDILVQKEKKSESDFSVRLRDLDILLVDDEKNLRSILSEIFDQMGNRVVSCENGTDALEKFKQGDFDLVVSDYDMDDLTGVELLTKIKEYDDQVITIMFSGWSLQNLQPYDNIVNGFIEKPFKPEDLIKLIIKVISEKRK